MGYGGSLSDAGIVTKASGDGGIDGIIKEDKLGLIAFTSKPSAGTPNPPSAARKSKSFPAPCVMKVHPKVSLSQQPSSLPALKNPQINSTLF